MSFNKISGYETEKKELNNLRNMLRHAEDYRQKGIRIPKGVVLFGQPGVGKSVMARAMAGKGIYLIELRAGDCCGEDIGDLIRNAFEKAKANAPAILLLDEMDKLAGTSGAFFMEGNDEIRKILLQEMDRLDPSDTVLAVATCNDIKSIGEALLRPGRFDRIIQIDPPDEQTREKILKHYFSQIHIPLKTNIDYIARITRGYTGAMLECLVNEAAILCTESNEEGITDTAIKTVMNRMTFAGYEKDASLDETELKRIAIHEAGHAIVAMLECPEYLQGASITPQGGSGGHIELIAEEKVLPSVNQYEKEIKVLLAGRIAERVITGNLGIGAENDLGKAASKLVYLIINQGNKRRNHYRYSSG